MKKYAIHIALMLALVATYAVAQAGAGEAGGGQAGNGAAPGQGQAGAADQQQNQSATGTQQGDEGQAKAQDRDKDKDKNQDKNAKVDDQTLQRQVREQLSSRPDFQSIQVAVKNAVVELTGSVPKKEDRQEAAELAKAVPGVRKVHEHLSIGQGAQVGEASRQSREEAGEKSAKAGEQGENTALQGQIQQEIQKQPALATSNVAVNVMNNQVILSGSVPSDQAKQQAQQIAEQHAGGLQVVNNINVGASVGAASAGAGGVSGAATGAQAQGQPSGQAGATGAVGAQAGQNPPATGAEAGQQQPPASTTSETGGMAPDQLKAQLQQAFQSEPTLSACNITSNVTADSIELAGTCPTGKEKQTARRMAQSLAGNRRVVDRITVSGKGEGEGQEKNQGPPPQF